MICRYATGIINVRHAWHATEALDRHATQRTHFFLIATDFNTMTTYHGRRIQKINDVKIYHCNNYSDTFPKNLTRRTSSTGDCKKRRSNDGANERFPMPLPRTLELTKSCLSLIARNPRWRRPLPCGMGSCRSKVRTLCYLPCVCGLLFAVVVLWHAVFE
jgi:hypothetical protein